MGRRPAALLAALAVAAAVAGCGGGDGPPAAARPDPVLFVHGFGADASTWDAAIARLRADGWPADRLQAWTYDTSRSNAVTARGVEQQVAALRRRTGAARVDVVTHSMGGLSTRWYLARLGDAAGVDAWVSLGGPNHGTTGLRGCRQVSCGDMQPGSPFLRALNAGDETPGAVRYATWWSPCDTVIDPDTSVPLDGARNTRTACLAHGALVSDPAVLAEVRDFLRGSLGGPNYGTTTANLCFFQTSCTEMRPNSAFLAALNSGDETPGAVSYGTWWSPCDEVINPDSSVLLTGATNTQTACMGHSALYQDATVYAQVREFVR